MSEMTMRLTFPTICAKCGKEFGKSELRIGRVLAGSAWDPENVFADGRQYVPLEEGAHLYTTESYHEKCVPPESNPA